MAVLLAPASILLNLVESIPNVLNISLEGIISYKCLMYVACSRNVCLSHTKQY